MIPFTVFIQFALILFGLVALGAAAWNMIPFKHSLYCITYYQNWQHQRSLCFLLISGILLRLGGAL